MQKFTAQILRKRIAQRVTVFSAFLFIGFASLIRLAQAGEVLVRAGLSVSPEQARLTINDFSQWDAGLVWASVSVRDSSGGWVTGLTLDDFQLTEALLSPSGDVIEERTITFDEPDYQFHGPGFWERSVTAEKLDIVFVVDSVGSLADEMPGIRSELHEFVNRLQSSHVDFRFGAISYAVDTGFWEGLYLLPFHGNMEAEEIGPWIDDGIEGWREAWMPSVTYDALMFATDATEFDFRQDARKVIVVITDGIPQTIYGSWWHPQHWTAAALSAVEVLFKESYPDIEIFYCQPPDLRELQDYAEEDKNPRALRSGFDKLKELGVAKDIPWPFQQENISIAGGDIADSQYYFAWMSRLDLPDYPETYNVRVTVKVADAERPGEFLEGVFYYTPVDYMEDAQVVISVTDELGNPADDVWVYLYAEMGDRKETRYWQMSPTGGQIVQDIDVGKYYLVAWGGGGWYDYEKLRYIKRERIEVKSGGTSFSLQLQTPDKEIEFAKARGLLNDLRKWGYTEKPFVRFADEALAWLAQVEEGGVDWRELEAVKRFYVALSGYVNSTGYAEVEVERAVEDFIEGAKELRELLERLTNTGDDLHSWYKVAANIALLLAYSVPPLGPNPEAIGAYGAVETLADALLDYVKGPFVREVLPKLIEQLPVRSDLIGLLKTLVNTIILGKWDDMQGVLKSVIDLALDVAMDEVKDEIVDVVKQKLLDALASYIDIPEQAREIFRKAMMAFFDLGFGGWDSEDFQDDIKALVNDAIAQLGGKEKLLEELDKVFLRLQADESVGPGPLRDFILPLTHLVIKVCVENYEGGKINDDFAIEILARMFCNRVMLRPLYSEPLLHQMEDALDRARNFYGAGDRGTRENSMGYDFWHFSLDVMMPLNEEAWDALELQDSIDDWESLLSTITSAVRALQAVTAIACVWYPTFCDMIDDIDDLIAFLDALQVMTNVFEFGLKLENMASLRETTQDINPLVLPKYLQVTTLFPSGGAGLDIAWRAQDGMRYRVQWKGDIGDPEWNDLSEEIVAAGATASWTDSGALGVRRRFYRVIQVE
ncbi:MAG: hypothetical protein Q8Q12_09585 [bacterium]|nr:hypothetical protein [bacterium]